MQRVEESEERHHLLDLGFGEHLIDIRHVGGGLVREHLVPDVPVPAA